MEKIKNYEILPVGRAKNLQGEKGDFLIIYRTIAPLENNKSKEAYWLCQCKKCKEYFIKRASWLVTSSCTCECKNNLVGQKFDRWTVLSLCEKRTKSRGKIYHCACICGNEKDVPAEALRSGQSRSCGCLQKEKATQLGKTTRKDLTGQRFGKLIALRPIYSEKKDVHTKWICQCDCGNITEIDIGNLRSKKSQSCGCVNSSQEENIIKLLTKNNINFQYQYKFKDIENKKFDFFINNQYILEFDGQQHFKYSGTGWNTQEHFERTRKSDLIKNKYCFDNNIPLIRIPYKEEYNYSDLILETTRFLLTKENEQDYYN